MKKLNRIISSVVLVCFAINTISMDLAYALGPGLISGALRPDGAGVKEEVLAGGQKCFGLKHETKIPFKESTLTHVVGKAPVLERAFLVNNGNRADYYNQLGKDPIFLESTTNVETPRAGLIKGLQYFMRNNASLGERIANVSEKYYDIKNFKKGELPLARLLAPKNDTFAGPIELEAHTDLVARWVDVLKNEPGFFYTFPDGSKRAISLAQGLLYRIARHEMTELDEHGFMSKGVGHVIPVYPGKTFINSNELIANSIGGNYALVNDAIWLWFLASYCYNDSGVKYDNRQLEERIKWIFESKKARKLKLPLEFPNLIQNEAALKEATELALWINYHFYKSYKETPFTAEDNAHREELIREYGRSHGAEAHYQVLPATGRGDSKVNAPKTASFTEATDKKRQPLGGLSDKHLTRWAQSNVCTAENLVKYIQIEGPGQIDVIRKALQGDKYKDKLTGFEKSLMQAMNKDIALRMITFSKVCREIRQGKSTFNPDYLYPMLGQPKDYRDYLELLFIEAIKVAIDYEQYEIAYHCAIELRKNTDKKYADDILMMLRKVTRGVFPGDGPQTVTDAADTIKRIREIFDSLLGLSKEHVSIPKQQPQGEGKKRQPMSGLGTPSGAVPKTTNADTGKTRAHPKSTNERAVGIVKKMRRMHGQVDHDPKFISLARDLVRVVNEEDALIMGEAFKIAIRRDAWHTGEVLADKFGWMARGGKNVPILVDMITTAARSDRGEAIAKMLVGKLELIADKKDMPLLMKTFEALAKKPDFECSTNIASKILSLADKSSNRRMVEYLMQMLVISVRHQNFFMVQYLIEDLLSRAEDKRYVAILNSALNIVSQRKELNEQAQESKDKIAELGGSVSPSVTNKKRQPMSGGRSSVTIAKLALTKSVEELVGFAMEDRGALAHNFTEAVIDTLRCYPEHEKKLEKFENLLIGDLKAELDTARANELQDSVIQDISQSIQNVEAVIKDAADRKAFAENILTLSAVSLRPGQPFTAWQLFDLYSQRYAELGLKQLSKDGIAAIENILFKAPDSLFMQGMVEEHKDVNNYPARQFAFTSRGNRRLAKIIPRPSQSTLEEINKFMPEARYAINLIAYKLRALKRDVTIEAVSPVDGHEIYILLRDKDGLSVLFSVSKIDRGQECNYGVRVEFSKDFRRGGSKFVTTNSNELVTLVNSAFDRIRTEFNEWLTSAPNTISFTKYDRGHLQELVQGPLCELNQYDVLTQNDLEKFKGVIRDAVDQGGYEIFRDIAIMISRRPSYFRNFAENVKRILMFSGTGLRYCAVRDFDNDRKTIIVDTESNEVVAKVGFELYFGEFSPSGRYYVSRGTNCEIYDLDERKEAFIDLAEASQGQMYVYDTCISVSYDNGEPTSSASTGSRDYRFADLSFKPIKIELPKWARVSEQPLGGGQSVEQIAKRALGSETAEELVRVAMNLKNVVLTSQFVRTVMMTLAERSEYAEKLGDFIDLLRKAINEKLEDARDRGDSGTTKDMGLLMSDIRNIMVDAGKEIDAATSKMMEKIHRIFAFIHPANDEISREIFRATGISMPRADLDKLIPFVMSRFDNDADMDGIHREVDHLLRVGTVQISNAVLTVHTTNGAVNIPSCERSEFETLVSIVVSYTEGSAATPLESSLAELEIDAATRNNTNVDAIGQELAQAAVADMRKASQGVFDKDILGVIDSYSIDIGQGALDITPEEKAAFYPVFEELNRETVNIFLSQSTKNSLAQTIKDEISKLNQRIRERAGRADDAINIVSYDSANLRTVLRRPVEENVRNIFVSDPIMNKAFAQIMEEETAHGSGSSILRGKKIITLDITSDKKDRDKDVVDVTNDKKDRDKNTVRQAWLMKVSILSALVSGKNINTVGNALKAEITERIKDADEFVNRLANTENESPDGFDIHMRVQYFLGNVVKLSEFIGQQLRILKAFWTAA